MGTQLININKCKSYKNKLGKLSVLFTTPGGLHRQSSENQAIQKSLEKEGVCR